MEEKYVLDYIREIFPLRDLWKKISDESYLPPFSRPDLPLDWY